MDDTMDSIIDSEMDNRIIFSINLEHIMNK
jgi:hypothetical protein